MLQHTAHRRANRRALLVFVIMLALVMSAIGFTVSALQKQYLRDESRKQLATELALLGELSVDSLLRSDYAAVERLVQSWVTRHAYPMRITATTPNGFELITAHNQGRLAKPLSIEQTVRFGGRQLMTLRAVADLSAREQGVSAIAGDAALIAAVAVLVMGWLLWTTLQRTAIRPLEHEIDERRQTERALRQRSAELEAAMRELESFSYSVSHDLRAPLRAIDGYSQALVEDYGKALDETAQSYLERTRAAAQRMGHLIDDLLALARVSRHELSLTEVDLSVLARDSIERLARAEPGRQVAVTIAETPAVRADARLAAIALDNLLDNAWKYTAHIPNAQIEFGMGRHDSRPMYFVRDNGIGFDMQYADKLFRPFQRLHGADYPGTGIGLATVARIIQRHGGKVWAEGRPGQGATFFFTLP